VLRKLAMKSIGITIIAIALSTLACDKPAGTPATLVHDFYTAFPAGVLDSGSEPTEVAMRRVAPYLSLRLRGLILDAVAYRESWGCHHPPRPGVNGGPWEIDKPPFAEGFGFTSNDEGFGHFTVSRTVPGPNDTWKVSVRFGYACTPRCSPYEWEDTAIVKLEQHRYVIDDVLFASHDPGEPQVLLSTGLQQRPSLLIR